MRNSPKFDISGTVDHMKMIDPLFDWNIQISIVFRNIEILSQIFRLQFFAKASLKTQIGRK